MQAENYELKESLKVFQSPDIKKILTLYRTGEIERLEQENKELKELKCKFKEYCTCDTERLQAENERLNSICLQLQSSELKQHLEKVNCERENYELRKENEELKKRQITKNGFICDCEQNVKYRQALEEIRNLAELEVILDKNSKAFYPANVQRTLDVINEVLK